MTDNGRQTIKEAEQGWEEDGREGRGCLGRRTEKKGKEEEKGEWIYKLWYSHALEYYTAVKRNTGESKDESQKRNTTKMQRSVRNMTPSRSISETSKAK